MKNTAFYIASRYLLSKKGSTAVTFITWLAAVAMMVAVCAMFVIVSVFSGLEDLNRDMVADLHADLTIYPAKGKTLQNVAHINKILSQSPEIEHFSKVIEEKVYVNYKDLGDIAYLRGVDSAYALVNPIDKSVFYGSYPTFKYSNEVLMENALDNRLAIPAGAAQDDATVMMPKPGTGMIRKEEDIFNKKDIFVSGIFPGKDQLNNYIISPIELAQELLGLPRNTAYSIVVKLVNPENAAVVKQQLALKIGNTVIIKTKEEENSAFWKMINTEKGFIYLIFALVILITTFNLAGAIIILQLDKQAQAKSLISMGMRRSDLRDIYFYTGVLIVLTGILAGLFLGTILCLIQMQTGFFNASANLPFPVRITWQNYAIVSATALLFGLLVSALFSRTKNPEFN